MEEVWVSRYELEAANALNSRSTRRFVEGALVRIGPGFGCLHPWPELGDPTLEECLADLAGARQFRIVKKTLVCIEADGGAREEGRSLFEGTEIPISHATLPELSGKAVEKAVERGFSHVKTKAGRDVVNELEWVRQFMGCFPGLRWRIDFNETGKFDELTEIFQSWKIEELGRIDFLEDPVRYHSGKWSKLSWATGLSLANDRHQEEDGQRSDVLVCKPAVDDLNKGSQRMVVTSYMDHPLGQCFAAWEAGAVRCREICGLQTHDLFERSVFSEVLGDAGPEFRPPGGIGLGFGDLLEDLQWFRLKG